MREVNTIVLGAGISGLSFAQGLLKAGFKDFLMLEAEQVAGGKIRTIKKDGYLLEAGPNSLMAKSDELERILLDLDLTDQIEFPQAKERFLNRNGELYALNPKNVIKLLNKDSLSKLLSFGLLCPSVEKQNETVAEFVKRTLGSSVLDNLVQPFVSGIHAGDVDQLMIESAFPKLYKASQHSFFLPWGLYKTAKQRKNPDFKGIFTFKEGIQTLTNALAAKIGSERLYTANTVLKIEYSSKSQEGILVSTKDEVFRCKKLVSTIPALPLARILDERESSFVDLVSYLKGFHYPQVKVLHLGFDREQLPGFQDGFGYLNLQKKRNSPVLGCLFPSSMFPNRAPSGKILLTFFVGGSMYEQTGKLGAQECMELACEQLHSLMGLQGEPEMIEMQDWPGAIPQYNLHQLRFANWLAQWNRQNKNIHIYGNFVNGISVPDCIVNHLQAGQDWV